MANTRVQTQTDVTEIILVFLISGIIDINSEQEYLLDAESLDEADEFDEDDDDLRLLCRSFSFFLSLDTVFFFECFGDSDLHNKRRCQ